MKPNSQVVIPFMLPWDWSADYQRQTCITLSEKFHYHVYAYMQKDAVFWIKSLFRKKTYPVLKNISFYQPVYFLPFRRIQIIEKLNRIISYRYFEVFVLRCNTYFLWMFDPYFFDICNFSVYGTTIYDCVDYHSGTATTNTSKEIKNLEDKLIKKVDHFFVNSQILYTIHSKIRIPDALVPQGFNSTMFDNPMRAKKGISFPKPTIGYVGALSHRLDIQLLLKLVRHHPEWNFVFWGKIQETEENLYDQTVKKIRELKKYNNIFLGYSSNKEEIPHIISQFNIAIIPYNVTISFNRFSYPMKLFEYFYSGKPVITSNIEELKKFPEFVFVAHTYTDWERLIGKLLNKKWPQRYKDSQKKISIVNSWDNKIVTILKICEN